MDETRSSGSGQAPEAVAEVPASTLHHCVISHTHWDREWYLPFEQFRMRLVDLIDHVLEILETDPEYVFHLDAQTIVLEDYLQIRPHRREQLEQRIRQKRLLVGPWYVQNDFYLTSGEATIRNLLIGSAIAKSFGACGTIGYVPDQFGLISQLPQIFNGFGIKDCVFGRGYEFLERNEEGNLQPVKRKNEVVWKGEEGSSVLAILMSHWYNNAQRFSADRERAAKYLRLISEAARERASTPYLLLMNGVDHLEAQEDLLGILAELDGQLDGAKVYQTTLEDYVAKVREYLKDRPVDSHTGEMRYGSIWNVLPGTLSSRVYLKTANVRAQALLENQIEPLYSLLALAGRPEAYPTDYLAYLWKQLIPNHAHDSICGCSRDEVHRNMEDRYERIEQCGGDILERGMKFLLERVDPSTLNDKQYLFVVCNTLKDSRSEALCAEVLFPVDDKVEAFRVLDPKGTPVAFEILKVETRQHFITSPINLPGEMTVEAVTLRLEVKDLEGLSWRSFIVEPSPEASLAGAKFLADYRGAQKEAKAASPCEEKPAVLENEYLKAVVHADGQVDLLDKERGNWTRDLLRLEDEADLGHSYNFLVQPDSKPFIAGSESLRSIEALECSGLAQSLRLSYEPELPEAFDFDASKRSPKLVANPISLTLELRKGVPYLEISAEVENRSRDHRLRLVVNTDIESDFSYSSTPFDFVKRDRRDLLSGVKSNGTQPNSGTVWVSDGKQSLAVFNEALYEYEHLMDERQGLALTLVRATGFISREFGEHQPPKQWVTPDNQCLRKLSMRLAVMPGGESSAKLENQFRAFLVPVLSYFDSVDSHKFSGGRPCVQDTEVQEFFYRDVDPAQRTLPLEAAPLGVKSEAVVLSALKRSEDGKQWIVRLYNPTSLQQEASVQVGAGIAKVSQLRLDELPVKELAVCSGKVALKIAPKQIVTLGLQ